MDAIILILTNDHFWIGISALAAVVMPVAIPYIAASKKLTKELVELHNIATEKNDNVKNRALDNGLNRAAKFLDKKLK